ncbi:hypothetical protein LVJ94_25355 [Pendulispora rubella]|uniref:Uncharacterized protein n=1 Tax=Pendulispora rubella TaxID=2741070 RepID=A0ABZ2LMY1_9BACT
MSSLDDAARARLAALADLLIPADGDMPAASGAGVAGAGVDAVLAARPDLLVPLHFALSVAAYEDAAHALSVLRDKHPMEYTALGELVAGAYYLHPDIQRRMGYRGRQAITIEIADGTNGPMAKGDAELLSPVVKRGPIWRADPRGQK